MPLEFHQVDAFSDKPFAGNPAVVYRLDGWLDDSLMQQIAAEHNLAETAFVVKEGAAWRIRWFTPTTEAALCGHATLASAHVLFECYDEPAERIEFLYAGGELAVSREKDRLVLDFPCHRPVPIAVPEGLAEMLGQVPLAVLDAPQLLVLLDSEAAVRACRPDLRALGNLPWDAVIISAAGETVDFVSRNFAPAVGIDEDPVTGSAHCILTPYWAQKLGKRELTAYQGGERGGFLWCCLDGERVKIAGHAHLVSSGRLHFDG
ncbi:putative PhzF superfamily epimerase YddE/YHI9 [Pseudomonas sp. BIGb0408]|uniref:Putative PhzF superfamily epimerase YddE/YHI9 n=1 Tax=Phytopseudomonas flavescens TaxID=29435 RepID=A0A7Y9XKE0_9GAMM|nr:MULTISPECIES: PhzF family phenazine biosynthesis protein [Pseudomonas]MCW2293702.1 putative PhzF superfamily epimerase YddE/YHI9 [Pseudomonas sp. BIGb0408]NYH71729.1 putative PhzF superfamily epimerase YddE/YHI9 [Pseudomonas flavescens]